jgi:hypothetical protein
MIEIAFRVFSIAFSVCFLQILFKNPSKAFWLGYFIVLAIPFSGTNKLINLVEIFPLEGFSMNIIHVIVYSLFFVTIYRKGKFLLPKERFSYITIILLSCYMMSLFIGFLKNPFIDVLKDFQKYLLQIMWLFVLIERCRSDVNENKLLSVTSKALTIGFLSVIFMNIFRDYFSWLILEDNLLSTNKGQADLDPFGYGVLSLAIFPITLFFVQFFQKNKTKNVLICGIVSLVYILFFSQGRTVLLTNLAAGTAVILMAVLISKRSLVMRIFMFTIISGVGIVFGAYFLGTDSRMVTRLLATDLLSEGDTLLTRIMTIQYYSGLIMDNALGYGFGQLLPLVNQFGRFHGEGSFYTDCLWINLGMKGGWLTILFFGIFVFIPIKDKFKKFIENRNLYDFAYFCAMGVFIFTVSMMTGQLMHNYQIMLGGSAFVVVLSNRKKETIC